MKGRTNTRLVMADDDDDIRRGGTGESNRARFKRIATDRVSKALDAIQYCEKLANTAVYDARPGEKEQIIRKLTEQVGEVVLRTK